MTASLSTPVMTIGDTRYTARIGRIERTFFGIEDHGFLTWVLHMNFGGSGQGAGTIAMDYRVDNKRRAHPGNLELMRRVMEVVGVDSWENIPGRSVYALKEEQQSFGMILGIANLHDPETTYVIFRRFLDDLSS